MKQCILRYWSSHSVSMARWNNFVLQWFHKSSENVFTISGSLFTGHVKSYKLALHLKCYAEGLPLCRMSC